MALIPLSQLDDHDLVNSIQDCRGWQVQDATGNALGTVREMFIDTDREVAAMLVLDSGETVLTRDVTLDNGAVVLRGAGGNRNSGGAQEIETRGQMSDTPAVSKARTAAGVNPVAGENGVVLPVIEEEMHIGKRAVERGGVRLRTHVEEVPIEEEVRLREERVNVERRPANRPAGEVEMAAFKEGTIEIAETREEIVINKQARVVEEIVVNKEVSERLETVRDTVRRTDVEVEKLEADARSNEKERGAGR